MSSLYKHSVLAVLGLLAVLLSGPRHLAMPDATAGPPLAFSTKSADAHAFVGSSKPLLATSARADALRPGRLGKSALRALAEQDPWGLARRGKLWYEREIRDYTCVFLKQERIDGKLGGVEEIDVRYRVDPKSVYMIWKQNAGQAKRALFVDSPEFVDDKGAKLARVEPAGVLIRLLVSDVMMPIHGKRARESSRRSIDEFGFFSTLGLLDRFNQRALDSGVLDLRFEGEGEIDGRPTFVIVRHLPYTGEGGVWPDAKMVMHLDQEWLLPTAVYSYADPDGTKLLGSYVLTQVKLNAGLTDDAFRF